MPTVRSLAIEQGGRSSGGRHVAGLAGRLMRRIGTPNPHRAQVLDVRFDTGSGFVFAATYPDGRREGDGFGVRGDPSETAYGMRKGLREARSGIGARLYSPALQYFLEFPFRIVEADRVAYVDDVELNGRLHHRVFATWGAGSGHARAPPSM